MYLYNRNLNNFKKKAKTKDVYFKILKENRGFGKEGI